MRGSNSRPSQCKCAALPTELIAQTLMSAVAIYYPFLKYYQYPALAVYCNLYMMEIYCVVTGKVQGVGYRDFVQGAAAELGLCGSVKNLSSGEVEVIVQGQPELLREFVEYLNEGSLLARVDGVSVEWRTAKMELDDFSVVK